MRTESQVDVMAIDLVDFAPVQDVEMSDEEGNGAGGGTAIGSSSPSHLVVGICAGAASAAANHFFLILS